MANDDEKFLYPIHYYYYYHRHHHLLKVLRLLEDATNQFQTNSDSDSDSCSGSSSPTQLLLSIETELGMFLSADPRLSTLSSLLSQLKILVQTQEESKSKHRIRSFLTNRIRAHEISRVSRLIELEIQAWMDRQNFEELVRILQELSSHLDSSSSSIVLSTWDEENLITKLSQLRERLDKGFDIKFQDELLKSRIYSLLECLLINRASISKRVREMGAYTLQKLVLFNKDVFVGQVLAGQTVKALVAMRSICGLDVIKSLIRAIKSPLVDELNSSGGILKIVNILSEHNNNNNNNNHSTSELGLKIMAVDCIMEIGYYGRKEAIESMIEKEEADLIKKLVDLQRTEWGGVLIEMEKEEDDIRNSRSKKKKKEFLEKHPFASIVARFAVQLEVGEGLRQREKREFKQEILKRVREDCVSDAEAATIIAEVLWGSSP